jgi:hypothetical protein
MAVLEDPVSVQLAFWATWISNVLTVFLVGPVDHPIHACMSFAQLLKPSVLLRADCSAHSELHATPVPGALCMGGMEPLVHGSRHSQVQTTHAQYGQ